MKRWTRALLLLTVMVVIALFLPGYRAARAQENLSGCKANLSNLAVAMDLYAADNHGSFPHSLERMVGTRYMRELPRCPQAGLMTYQEYWINTNPDRFTVGCSGDNHRKAYPPDRDSAGFPRYVSGKGLVDP